MNEKLKLMDNIRYAIIDGDISLAKELIEKNPELLNCKTRSGGTLLHCAVGYNHQELVEYLLVKGIDVNIESPASGEYGTAINSCLTVEMAEFLLSRGIKPNLTIGDDKNPLFFQLRRKNIVMIKFWLDYELKELSEKDGENLVKVIKAILDSSGELDLLADLSIVTEKNMLKCNEEFAYEVFYEELLECIKSVFSEICNKYQDYKVYSFSLACTNLFDDLYFVANTSEYLATKKIDYSLDYKYNEDEWEIWVIDNEHINKLSAKLKEYNKKITDKKQKQIFHNKLIELYVQSLSQLRKINYFTSDILLNIYIREYLSEKEMICIFKELNGEDRTVEYKRFLMA